MYPQLRFTQVYLVVPAYSITTLISLNAPKQGAVGQGTEDFIFQQGFAIVDLLDSIAESNQQTLVF